MKLKFNKTCDCPVITLAVSVTATMEAIRMQETSAKFCAECGAPMVADEVDESEG